MDKAPEHDLNMPHDTRYTDQRSCPPNCPYLTWYRTSGWKMAFDRCAVCGVVRRSHDPSPHAFHEPGQLAQAMYTTRDAAEDFMMKCGLVPTQDAADQLVEAFLPCLQIMCQRGYDPEGTTWREKGWKGLVHDILNKAGRLRFHSWKHNRFDIDSARDMINFCGFYIRLENNGKKWGKWGKPG